MAQLFNLTTDQIINYDGKMPKEVVIEDKTAVEQMRLIQQLDEEDKQTIFKLIDKMLTNNKRVDERHPFSLEKRSLLNKATLLN